MNDTGASMTAECFIAMCLLCGRGGPPAAPERPRPTATDEVVRLIASLNDTADEERRADLAEEVCDRVARDLPALHKGRVLRALMRRLDDRNDAVVLWVVTSIGQFGKDAGPLLPLLKALLKVKAKLKGSKTSASALRFAIGRIEGELGKPAKETGR